MRYKGIFKNGIILLVIAMAATSFAQVQKVYVNVPQENLRNAPNGVKLGSLLENTEMTVLVDKGDWVKVQVTGWMWKGSLSSVKKVVQGQYRALHILVKTRTEAETVLAELKGGADFSATAKKKSIAPNSVVGGDLGYFNKGDFESTIENAILALSQNQISPIVETSYGFNIFKRLK